jgi:hypothetical protein
MLMACMLWSQPIDSSDAAPNPRIRLDLPQFPRIVLSRVQGQRLRLAIAGPTGARSLSVLFPDAQVSFGDARPGDTTPYRDVPNGVYSYAAYRLEIDGQLMTQPVIDWVGERPMEGRAFTYTLDIDTGRPLRVGATARGPA